MLVHLFHRSSTSLKQVSTTAATALVVGLATATVGLTGSAAARADSTAVLPLSHYAHMLVDTVHRHLFFSQGAGSTGIVVTDLAGTPVTTIEDERGATGLALSGDGATLYAALADGDAVAAIDTATLTESTRYPGGTGSAPASVAVAALTFGGELSDGPYGGGERVTVSRTDAAHTTKPVTWTAPVGTDGTVTVKDTPTTGGTATYTVGYPGDASHQPATASAIVQVSRAAAALSVTTKASSSRSR
ncbi:hypothetical protein [Streptomyces sp. NPDC046976]|uniref:hypothetical protein n=1 Tax=Streptomyces sp. NPDC046976 TaxID=3155258 RepID=UPI0033EE3D06